MARTYYTQADIAQAVTDYANHYDIETEAVDVSRNYEGDGPNVIGFCLSADGCDDYCVGEWR